MKNIKEEFERKINQELSIQLPTPSDTSIISVGESAALYSTIFSDKILIIKIIRQGVSYPLYQSVADYAPFSEADWAAIFDISTKSLQRYKQMKDFRFRPIHSEKILEIAEVIREGLEVFGDLEKFQLWLDTPNYALGNILPKELLKDSYGKDLLMAELIRISHGILA